MARLETWYKQDLKKPLIVHKHADVFNQDSRGNLIGVEVYKDGEPVTLAGSISGYCLLADGTTVPAVSASRSGNKASVLIPRTAYSVPGPITITIKNVEGNDIATLCAVVGLVRQSVSGNLANPGSVVTDWSNSINAQLQAVQTAADNVGAIVAAPFDENTVYVVGNYVTNNGNLYRITGDHASGVAWGDTSKVQCTVGSELSDLKSALSDNLYPLTEKHVYKFDATKIQAFPFEFVPGEKYTFKNTTPSGVAVGARTQEAIDSSTATELITASGNIGSGVSVEFTVTQSAHFLRIYISGAGSCEIVQHGLIIEQLQSITKETETALESMAGTKYTYDTVSGERVFVSGDTGQANPGDFVEVTGYVRTDYIDVEFIENIVFTHSGNGSSANNAFYDKDKHFISSFGYQWQGTKTVVPVVNAKYVVVSWKESDNLNIKMNYKEIYPMLNEMEGTVDSLQYIKGNATGNVVVLDSTVIGTPLKVSSELPTNKKYHVCSRNIVYSEYAGETINGVTCVNNGDGTFTVNGTATGGNARFIIDTPILPNGICKLTGCPLGGGTSTYRLALNGYGGDEGNSKDVNVSTNTYSNDLSIVVYENATVNNLVFKPMITIGSSFSDFVKGVERQEATVTQLNNNTKELVSAGNGTVIFNDNNLSMNVVYDKYSVTEEVNKMISDADDNSVSAYYDSYLESKLATIKELNDKIGTNGFRFIFITDYHDYYNNANRSPALIRKICDRIPVPVCVFGGDGPNMANDIAEMRVRLVDFLHRFDGIDGFYPIIGNHEFYSNWSNPGDYKGGITASEVYYYFYKSVEMKMCNGDATKAYYIDNKVQKIRMYFVGCDYYYQTTNETITWMLNSFSDIPDGYRVIVVAHAAMKGNGTELYDSFAAVHGAMVAVNNRTTYEYGGITHDYSNVNAKIPFVLCGHTHVDNTGVFDGIRYICTTTDNWFLGKQKGENREMGTVTEQAFDVVSVSYDSYDPKIYLTRIGYGNDRAYTLNI